MNPEILNNNIELSAEKSAEYFKLYKNTPLINKTQIELVTRILKSTDTSIFLLFVNLYSEYFKKVVLKDLVREEDNLEEKLNPNSPDYNNIINIIQTRLTDWKEPPVIESLHQDIAA